MLIEPFYPYSQRPFFNKNVTLFSCFHHFCELFDHFVGLLDSALCNTWCIQMFSNHMKSVILKTILIVITWLVSIDSFGANTISQLSLPEETPITELDYPVTPRVNASENYFGIDINDPYRWLENDLSPEVTEWVKEENKLTQQYLEKIPYRQSLSSAYEEMLDYERVSMPFPEGSYTYFYKNSGLQNQSVLYRQKIDGETEIFIDPNRFSDDGTVSMESISFSKDGSLVAYAISEGGSDWQKIVVMDAETRTVLEPALEDIKFSNIAWLGNQGFYYSSYEKPEGSVLSGKTEHHKLYFHKLGDQQKNDQVIFGASDGEQYLYVSGYTTEDERFLVISCSESTSGNKLFIKDLITANSSLVTVLDHFESDTQVVDNQGDELFLTTNLGAEKGKLVKVNANAPGTENWQTVIPENSHVPSVSTGSGYLFAHYMVDALSR